MRQACSIYSMQSQSSCFDSKITSVSALTMVQSHAHVGTTGIFICDFESSSFHDKHQGAKKYHSYSNTRPQISSCKGTMPANTKKIYLQRTLKIRQCQSYIEVSHPKWGTLQELPVLVSSFPASKWSCRTWFGSWESASTAWRREGI